ncbi:probable asparagine--tRNA ligase, mitochondrial [Aplysia californica]|uniref:asparagine--tRNA ligase n=1 Tax=Aplysia californica TaxID=6500 RepID=A0ABM1A4A4_APLCA|nr:probable asparagine--tRNA ligase, mitochondrial [Aplysia californica]
MAASLRQWLCRQIPNQQIYVLRTAALSVVKRSYKTVQIRKVLREEKLNKSVTIKGWVKAVRWHKELTFLQVCDGSGPEHLQVVMPESVVTRCGDVTFGSCVSVEGTLVESQGKGQKLELLSSAVHVVGGCDPYDFPLKQRTRHPPQYTRDFLHMRPKSNLFGSLLRIRNAASMAVHQYFQKEGCIFIHTPILTSSDCEGACETFKVEPSQAELRAKILPDEGSDYSDDDELSRGPVTDMSNEEKVLGTKEFFNSPTYLTVSGQLHLEVMTGAMNKVYNFGPTFRAENSIGSFHLSEFYMVEAEYAFMERLGDLLTEMENLVKFVYRSVMDSCPEDVHMYHKYIAPASFKDKVEKTMSADFKRITYTEAIDILTNAAANFRYKVFWGCDLKKEHEMYLTAALGEVPVFVTDYPAQIKPFYARRNDDDVTVSAADLLVPGVGELCGSSLREERVDILQAVMEQHGLVNQIPWYLELRQFGTCPHGGFGLGFERLLLGMLGAQSLKDVIPFPRWPGRCRT